LIGADLQNDGPVVVEGHRVGPVAQHAAPEVGDGDERALIALLDEPFQVIHIG
jgi:hypothetical protein